MRRFFADIGWVAVYELGEAVRTRLFQLVLLTYAAGIGASTWVLVRILGRIEEGLAGTLGVPATERPGAMMGTLLENGDLTQLVGPAVDQPDEVVEQLLREPIVGLWTGVTSMALLPLVLVFSASASIASEVKSRSIRYLSCRTGRLQIGLGKLVGQLLIAIVAALAGAAVAWALGMTLMVGNPPVALALSLVARTLRAVVWALPFAGLGLLASQWVTNPNGARVLGAGLLVAMAVGSALAEAHAGPDTVGRLADLSGLFLATNGWSAFWSTDPAVLAEAMVRGVVLAVVYYAAGHAVFARRDL